MKLAVIGSSHSVALKLGWDAMDGALAGRITPMFFAVGGQNLPFFACDASGVLRVHAERGSAQECRAASDQAQAINAKTDMDLTDFDAVCFVGLNAGIEMLIRVIPQVQIGATAAPRSDPALPPKVLISEETFYGIQKAVLQRTLQSWPFQYLTGKKIYLMLPPRPFEKVLDRDVGRSLGQQIGAELRDNPEYCAMVDAYQQEFLSSLIEHHNATLIPQAPQTLCEHGMLTQDQYSNGALTLGGLAYDADDFSHANATYGQAMWHQFIDVALGPD